MKIQKDQQNDKLTSWIVCYLTRLRAEKSELGCKGRAGIKKQQEEVLA